ncbi:MAG: Low molecular weight protein tyrosine phosphatase, partial [uncultured Nocardioidaceae bacterium]
CSPLGARTGRRTASPWSASATSVAPRSPRSCSATGSRARDFLSVSRWSAPAPATGTSGTRWTRAPRTCSPPTVTTRRDTGPSSTRPPGTTDATWCLPWTRRTTPTSPRCTCRTTSMPAGCGCSATSTRAPTRLTVTSRTRTSAERKGSNPCWRWSSGPPASSSVCFLRGCART